LFYYILHILKIEEYSGVKQKKSHFSIAFSNRKITEKTAPNQIHKAVKNNKEHLFFFKLRSKITLFFHAYGKICGFETNPEFVSYWRYIFHALK